MAAYCVVRAVAEGVDHAYGPIATAQMIVSRVRVATMHPLGYGAIMVSCHRGGDGPS
jgi:hypothetical protein